VRWLADECFDNDIIRGLLRRTPDFDLVRTQDVPDIAGSDDGKLLAWATSNQRTVLTHDLATMIPTILLQRQQKSGCTPVVLVPDSLSTGAVIEDILLLDQCSQPADWAAGVVYLPLR
jgi:uncharacterized protein DUF5615